MRISDWSSDVCSSDLVNPDFDLGGITVGQAFDAVGFDPTPYLSTKKNFYRNYGYNDTGEADLDTHFDAATAKGIAARSEESRVGTECVSTCRSWWMPDDSKKNTLV